MNVCGSALLVWTTLVPTHQQSFAIGAQGLMEEFLFAVPGVFVCVNLMQQISNTVNGLTPLQCSYRESPV